MIVDVSIQLFLLFVYAFATFLSSLIRIENHWAITSVYVLHLLTALRTNFRKKTLLQRFKSVIWRLFFCIDICEQIWIVYVGEYAGTNSLKSWMKFILKKSSSLQVVVIVYSMELRPFEYHSSNGFLILY